MEFEGGEMMQVSIKAARINARLSQEDVAKALHVTIQTVGNWEAGRTAPRVDQFRQLAEVYGCTISDIVLPEN